MSGVSNNGSFFFFSLFSSNSALKLSAIKLIAPVVFLISNLILGTGVPQP